uniref:Uncharacterized protein n=1 Tax=Arundo donax TaxID=35708 RepID=A0A0A9DVD5_ARUDO
MPSSECSSASACFRMHSSTPAVTASLG